MSDNLAHWPLRGETEFACFPSAACWARRHTRDTLYWNLAHRLTTRNSWSPNSSPTP